MNDNNSRRPLKIREAEIPRVIARYLTKGNITPNQISITSTFFALLASFCLFFIEYCSAPYCWVLPLLAALFIQCRLLCNLFDGMVAVEGGKSTQSGELFNDFPDRISDIFIFVATGYAYGMLNYNIILGWIAALLAVLTAYTRTLASSIGAPTNFKGPMAKQQRMFIMTLACLLTPIENICGPARGYVLLSALIMIVLGSIITIIRRLKIAYRYLENQ